MVWYVMLCYVMFVMLCYVMYVCIDIDINMHMCIDRYVDLDMTDVNEM